MASSVIFTSFCERRPERKCKRTFCQNVFGFMVFMSTADNKMTFLSCCNFLNPFRLKSAESQSDGIITTKAALLHESICIDLYSWSCMLICSSKEPRPASLQLQSFCFSRQLLKKKICYLSSGIQSQLMLFISSVLWSVTQKKVTCRKMYLEDCSCTV